MAEMGHQKLSVNKGDRPDPHFLQNIYLNLIGSDTPSFV